MKKPAEDLIQLSALLDDELREAEAREIKNKLINSEELRSEYEYLKSLNRLLKKWDRDDVREIRASSTFERNLRVRLKAQGDSNLPSGIELSTISVYHV